MDKGYAQLTALCDHLWWADIERQRREYDARKAQARYEAQMLDEARALAAAGNDAACTAAHLAVLLSRLDEAQAKKEVQTQ